VFNEADVASLVLTLASQGIASPDALPKPAQNALLAHGEPAGARLAGLAGVLGTVPAAAPGFSAQPVGAVATTCPLDAATARPEHWIGIELVGDDDSPVPGEAYLVTLPDGTEVRGYLDAAGRAQIRHVADAGTCRIGFPRLDRGAWDWFDVRRKPAPREAPSAPPPPPARAAAGGGTTAGSHQDPTVWLKAFTAGPGVEAAPAGAAGVAVDAGDCASSIAWEQGHFWDDVWQLPENEALRDARSDPHVLLPGDKLYVPPAEPKALPAATDAHHRFRQYGIPEMLSIRLLDGDAPRAHLPYLLCFDSEDGEVQREGSTDGDGVLTEPIPPATLYATLFLEDDEFDLELGRLAPPATAAGAAARLVNLGLLPADAADDEMYFHAALGTFQKRCGVDVTHALDDATAAALDACYTTWPGELPDV
jgi:N-acetylmuramoyl-L-alanine amidase